VFVIVLYDLHYGMTPRNDSHRALMMAIEHLALSNEFGGSNQYSCHVQALLEETQPPTKKLHRSFREFSFSIDVLAARRS